MSTDEPDLTADFDPDAPREIEGTELVDGPTTLKLVAPLVALGATWAVGRVLDSVYTRVTGHHPPRANDPDASMRRILFWAATTAAAVAVVNVAIDRLTTPKRVEVVDD